MATIVLRSTKGSPLTNTEVDNNFNNLNVELGQKVDASSTSLTLAATAVTWSGNPTHSGNHLFSGNLTVEGNTVIGNVSTDTLTIFPNAITWQNNPTHSGNHTFSGNVLFNGNTTVGDASTDSFTINPANITWNNAVTHSNAHTFSGNVTLNGLLNIGNATKTAGKFDIGTVDPSNNTRLNYDGYLYATRYYGDATGLVGTAASLSIGGNAQTATTATTANATATGNSFQMGSVGVGTAASGTVGEIRATNNITAYYSSDRKFKENVADINNALDIAKKIGGKTFDWTEEYIESHGGEDGYFINKNDFGVIAQEVQEVFPLAVRTRDDGTLAVDYPKLCVIALAAIKELASKIEGK